MSVIVVLCPAQFSAFNQKLFGPTVPIFSWERLNRPEATDFLEKHAPGAVLVLCDRMPERTSAAYKRLTRYVRNGGRTVKVLTAFDKRDVASCFRQSGV
jgi:hypothetical protein